MIHTNELMLGNWVEYATGLNGEKRSIPMKVVALYDDTVYLNFDGNEGDVFEEEEKNLLGIPITEELLEKCGFHIELRLSPCFVLGNISVESFNDKWLVRDLRRGIVIIDYLHELQNAYFMLTKKHL